MNHDLGRALQDLANAGADHASPATLLAGRATNRIVALRRRRRVTVSAITLAAMAAAGTGAAAAISYFGHDRVSTFPDRLVPGVQAPAHPTGLQCDADVGDLTASTTPLVLGNEMAQDVGDSPVVIGLESASIIPMFLTNVTDEELSLTLAEGSGVYLIQDGRVVAEPVRTGSISEETVLPPSGNQTLLNDRVVACGAAGIPAGDYQAYGSIEVTVPGGEHRGTYSVVGGPWNVVVARADGTVEGSDDGESLAAADPTAIFPQCGAIVEASDEQSIWLSLKGEPPVTTAEQESTPLGVQATNRTTNHLTGDASGATFAVVSDGVVVGTATTSGAARVGAFDLAPEASMEVPAVLSYTACGAEDAASRWLPDWEYSIWGRQVFSVTEGSAAGEEIIAFNEVAMIWTEHGQPVIPAGQ